MVMTNSKWEMKCLDLIVWFAYTNPMRSLSITICESERIDLSGTCLCLIEKKDVKRLANHILEYKLKGLLSILNQSIYERRCVDAFPSPFCRRLLLKRYFFLDEFILILLRFRTHRRGTLNTLNNITLLLYI